MPSLNTSQYLDILRNKVPAFQLEIALQPIAAGLAVQAEDTGRVLMLQRAITPDDPASGKWEFPGGTLDPEETPIQAAIREWQEETGHKLPQGIYAAQWTSANNVYKLFVYSIPQESDLDINLDHEDRHALNPDDPDGDNIEVIAWFSPRDLRDNPAVRAEAQNTDWTIFYQTVKNALSLRVTTTTFSNTCHDANGQFCETHGVTHFSSEVEKYLSDQYKMSTDVANQLGIRQEGTKLQIPFRDENGNVTGYKWRDTAVKTGPNRWGPAESQGLSVYENQDKKGPLFVVESPSEGLILSALGHRVVFFDGADSLVSRTGEINPSLHNRLTDILKDKQSVLIPDNDTRGEAFAKVVEKLTTHRINPPSGDKDLREYLVEGGSLKDLTHFTQTDRVELTDNNLEKFYNHCHDEETGHFCEDPTTKAKVRIEKAPDEERKAAKVKAKAWIRIAKVPPEKEVIKGRLALAHARQASGRSGGEAHGGSSEQIAQQRHNLFKEFGGEKKGYVVDHQSGIKMHWTSDPAINPNQYPVFQRGRIFTTAQGGGYTLDNLIPESYDTNRARGSRTLRKENLH